MKHTTGVLTALLMAAGSIASAAAHAGEIATSGEVATSIDKAFVPQAFGREERVQLVIRAFQPNGCYKAGRTAIEIDRNRRSVTLTQYLVEGDEMCIQLVEHFDKEVDIGGLPPGTYTVHDASGNRRLGSFRVDARSDRPNRHVPITGVDVDESTGEITVAGLQTSGCIEVSELQSRFEGADVVVVQPVARVDENGLCTRDVREFRKSLRLRLAEPTLLHVKNADGSSINQVIY